MLRLFTVYLPAFQSKKGAERQLTAPFLSFAVGCGRAI